MASCNGRMVEESKDRWVEGMRYAFGGWTDAWKSEEGGDGGREAWLGGEMAAIEQNGHDVKTVKLFDCFGDTDNDVAGA